MTAVVAGQGGGPLAPGSWLGVLGGGQLGRMFCAAAQSLGYRVCVLDPDPGSPAGGVAERHLQADYLDAAALAEIAALCSAVTTEFENVPAAALATLARRVRVTPSAAAVAVAQDRIEEKAFLAGCGVPVAPHRAVHGAADLDGLDDLAAADALLPGILKVARLGYDGKGQARVATVAEARAALAGFANGAAPPPCVLERRLELACEVSVIVARGLDGQAVTWPVGENVHRAGILSTTTVPAAIDAALAARARDAALTIATRLDYVGVLCVEFFVLADGRLVANEIAPRPHNSGHWTIDAAVTSQFEQQARIMAGLPLGATDALWPSLMLNILGDAWLAGGSRREPDWAAVLAQPGAKLHLYGKAEARAGRKMGHLTIIAPTLAGARRQAAVLAPLVAQRAP
ncbi:MAG: 5-(carboxyamino)imidazole ribonucleotide synthase [Lautropia sp.]